MKKINTLIIAGAAGLLAIGTVSAQRGDGPRNPEGPMGNPLFAAIDTNGDGVLSTAEIGAAPESLAALDLNGDGQITRDEWSMRPRPEARGGERGPRRGGTGERPAGGYGAPFRPGNPLLRVLDTDGDGVLSAEEIANSWKNLLDLDVDGDGVITVDEIRAFCPRGKGPGEQVRGGNPRGRGGMEREAPRPQQRGRGQVNR